MSKDRNEVRYVPFNKLCVSLPLRVPHRVTTARSIQSLAIDFDPRLILRITQTTCITERYECRKLLNASRSSVIAISRPIQCKIPIYNTFRIHMRTFGFLIHSPRYLTQANINLSARNPLVGTTPLSKIFRRRASNCV